MLQRWDGTDKRTVRLCSSSPLSVRKGAISTCHDRHRFKLQSLELTGSHLAIGCAFMDDNFFNAICGQNWYSFCRRLRKLTAAAIFITSFYMTVNSQGVTSSIIGKWEYSAKICIWTIGCFVLMFVSVMCCISACVFKSTLISPMYVTCHAIAKCYGLFLCLICIVSDLTSFATPVEVIERVRICKTVHYFEY